MPGTHATRPKRHAGRCGRRLAAALASLLLAPAAAIGVVLGTAGPAHAAEIYRYWAYFHVQDGAFVASMKGVGEFRPRDGAVEAYRYAAPADFENPNLPRADLSTLTFEAICTDADAAEEGQKRVAVIIDYGVAEDAEGADVPAHTAACAVVPREATALQVLDSVAETRSENGLLCAIEGHPAEGCAGLAEEGTPADDGPVEFTIAGAAEAQSEAAADDDTASSSSEDGAEDDGSNLPLLLGVGGAVVVIGAGGAWLSRRNRRAA
jgi:hypothetical protein